MKPFSQGRFEDLPELPRLPHGYAATEGLTITVAAAGFPEHALHVRKHGSGPPLLLVHGLMTSSYSWRYVMGSLGRHHTCYALDLPGAGASQAPLTPRYSPQNLARVLMAAQRALGIEGCACIGNSMGGYICMVALLEHGPAAFSRLVQVHAPAIPGGRYLALKMAMAAPGSAALFRALVRKDPERWCFKNVHYHDETLKSLEEARTYAAPLKTEAGLEAFRKYLTQTMDASGLGRFRNTLRQRLAANTPWPVPMLLLYAAYDPLVPAETGPALKALIPDSELLVLQGVSHFMHVDGPEQFLPPVLRFLKAPPAG